MQSVDGVSLLTEANYETRVPSNEGDDTPKTTPSESESAAVHTRTLQTSNEVLSLSCSDIQIGGRIGAGGFGTVRRGLLRQHTEVALKTITHDEEKDQIVNELMLLRCALSGTYICGYIDVRMHKSRAQWTVVAGIEAQESSPAVQ